MYLSIDSQSILQLEFDFHKCLGIKEEATFYRWFVGAMTKLLLVVYSFTFITIRKFITIVCKDHYYIQIIKIFFIFAKLFLYLRNFNDII